VTQVAADSAQVSYRRSSRLWQPLRASIGDALCTSVEDIKSKKVVIAPIEMPSARGCKPRNSPSGSKSRSTLGSISLLRNITSSDCPPAIGSASLPYSARWLSASSNE
jgi:hypothetical protein